jgi:hypothetical protein
LKYHPDDIAPLDTMAHLQRNESQFFRSGNYDAIELAGMIATEALTLGAQKVHIQSSGEWLTVVADKDWLERYGDEAFHAITPFPEAGVNGMLAEVLAVAFSAGVATATPAEVKVVKGEDSPPAHPLDQGMARTVAIRRQRGLQPLVS